MANEAVKSYDESSGSGGVIQDYTVADGTGIEKGTVLRLTDPRTASATNTVGEALAGIAARDKVASDGRTRLSVYKKGYFEMKASGAITVGDAVVSATSNFVQRPVGAASGAQVLGYAEETATDGEVILVRVDL